MPKIRIRRQVTGTRNGVHWPEPGGIVDVSESDARVLIRHGHAEAVKEDPKSEQVKRKRSKAEG